jgi:hypothetical protein
MSITPTALFQEMPEQPIGNKMTTLKKLHILVQELQPTCTGALVHAAEIDSAWRQTEYRSLQNDSQTGTHSPLFVRQ